MRTRIISVIVVLILTAGATAARAQALADRVPGDAMLFVGWTGVDAQASACKASNFQTVLDHSDVQTFLNDFLPRVLLKIGVDAPQAVDAEKIVAQIVPAMWHHPTAFYFAGMSKQGQPRFALICQAGDDSLAMIDGFTDAFKRAGLPMAPIVAREGDLVVVEMGYRNAADAVVAAGGAGANALSADAGFKADMAQVDGQGAIVGYVNTAELFDFVATIPGLPPEVKMGVPKALAGLGLDGLKSAAFSQGFDGKDWSGRFFADAPSPRTGLLKLMETPFDDSILKLVPSTSISVSVGQADLAGAVGVLRDTAAGVNPQVGQMIDNAIAQANAVTGVDLRDDLLGSFGPTWVTYLDPMTAGNSSISTVIANRARNADKLASSLTSLEALANQTLAGVMPDKRIHLEFKQTSIGGVTIHYLATPLITPAWAIHDGVWYAALYPSVVASAVDNASAGKSILDNPDFAAMRTRLGNVQATDLTYIDLRATAPQAYPGLLAASRLVGVGDILGVNSPMMMVPTYRQLAPVIAPMGAVSWTDPAGFHSREIEPFPGSSLLSVDPSLFASLQSDFGTFAMMGFQRAQQLRRWR